MSESSEDEYYDGLLKYWSKTQKRMIRGAERARKPVSLRSLLGSYRWVYNGGWEADDEEREIDDPEWGVLTLYRGPKKTTTPKNIFGKFQMCMLSGTFEGLKVADVKDQESDMHQTAGNIWEINRVKWAEDDLPEDGNGIAATEVLDDAGHPFLLFYCTGSGGHFCGSYAPEHSVEVGELYLLKKQKKHGSLKFLSDAERRRLGFYFSDRDIIGEESGSGSDGSDEDEDDVDPYDREEALKSKRALKKEQLAVKLEGEAKNRVAEKRRAVEDLTHDTKRPKFSLALNEEE